MAIPCNPPPSMGGSIGCRLQGYDFCDGPYGGVGECSNYPDSISTSSGGRVKNRIDNKRKERLPGFDNSQPQSQPYMVSATSSSPSIGPAAGVIGFSGYYNQRGKGRPQGQVRAELPRDPRCSCWADYQCPQGSICNGCFCLDPYANQSGSLNPTGYKFDCEQATASMSFESSEAMRSWVADCKATEADDTENTSELELVGSEAIKQETKKNRNKILMFLIIGGALYYGYTKGLFSNRIN